MLNNNKALEDSLSPRSPHVEDQLKTTRSALSNTNRSNAKPFNSFGVSPNVNHQKVDHFGEIPVIPKKVVEVVQLDIVESYGRIEDGKKEPTPRDGATPRVVAAQKTTLYSSQQESGSGSKPRAKQQSATARKTTSINNSKTLMNRYQSEKSYALNQGINLDNRRINRQSSITKK